MAAILSQPQCVKKKTHTQKQKEHLPETFEACRVIHLSLDADAIYPDGKPTHTARLHDITAVCLQTPSTSKTAADTLT